MDYEAYAHLVQAAVVSKESQIIADATRAMASFAGLNSRSYLAFSDALAQSGSHGMATNEGSKAVNLDPTCAEAYSNLARLQHPATKMEMQLKV